MCIIPNDLMERDPMLQNCIEIYVLKNSKMLKKLHEIILWVSFLTLSLLEMSLVVIKLNDL